MLERAHEIAAGRSLAELADELRVDRRTVHNWVRRGIYGVRLPAIRIGRRVLVTPAALEAFLAQVEQATSTSASNAPAAENQES